MQFKKRTLLLAALTCVACTPDREPGGDMTLSATPVDTTATFDTNFTTEPDKPTTAGSTSEHDTTAETASTVDPGTTSGSTGGDDDAMTIYNIQKGKFPEDTVVQLKDVVVTSPVFLSKNDEANFFIAEQPGGEYSGIQVYVYADVTAELDSDGKLPNVGDVLDLNARYTEFFDYSELTLQSAGDLTIKGTGTVPSPSVVAAADVATSGAKAENYEGCLVQIVDATVTTPVVMYGQFTVDDVLVVDDVFFNPNPGPKPPMNTQFTALVGLMAYQFEVFTLNPRTCSDFQGWPDC